MASNLFDGIAGAGLNVLSGLWQNSQNKAMMREQMAWQTKEREASQLYQTGEREAAQKWNTSERVAQNKYGEDMYLKYQTPAALAKQYKDAGLNPLLAVGEGGAGAVGSASGSNVGMSQGGSPQSHGVTPPYQQIGAYSDMLSQAIGNLKTLGEARKLGIDVKYYEQQIKNNIKSQELQIIAQDFINSFNKKYLPAKAQAEIDNLMKDLEAKDVNIAHVKQTIENLKSQKVITDIEGDKLYEKITSEINKNKSETLRNEAEANLKDKMAVTEGYKPNLLKSETSRNFADASLKSQQEKTEFERTEYVKQDTRYMRAHAAIEEAAKRYTEATNGLKTDNQKYVNERFIEVYDKQIEMLESQLKEARARGDYAEVRQITGIIFELSASFDHITSGIQNLSSGNGKGVKVGFRP